MFTLLNVKSVILSSSTFSWGESKVIHDDKSWVVNGVGVGVGSPSINSAGVGVKYVLLIVNGILSSARTDVVPVSSDPVKNTTTKSSSSSFLHSSKLICDCLVISKNPISPISPSNEES